MKMDAAAAGDIWWLEFFVLQSQKAVTAYFTSKQLQPSGFSRRYYDRGYYEPHPALYTYHITS